MLLQCGEMLTCEEPKAPQSSSVVKLSCKNMKLHLQANQISDLDTYTNVCLTLCVKLHRDIRANELLTAESSYPANVPSCPESVLHGPDSNRDASQRVS